MKKRGLTLAAFFLCLLPLALQAGGSSPSRKVAANSSYEVPLRHQDGGLWVEVTLNGRVTSRMMVDTGASAVLLPTRVAAALGIEEDEGVIRQINTVQGVTKGRQILLRQIEVGGAIAHGIPAIIVDAAPHEGISLLGQSFLQRFSFSVDYDREVLELRPRAAGYGSADHVINRSSQERPFSGENANFKQDILLAAVCFGRPNTRALRYRVTSEGNT